MLLRYAAQHITTGHFDLTGALRLEAYGTRVMFSFLALCLHTVSNSQEPAQQSDELKLRTLTMSQSSNWSLENCGIDLSEEQAQRLYDTGIAYLI